MRDDKFVDPRLQAREKMFQQLHLSTFETMGYAHNIQSYVEKTGQDIESDHPDYQQLLRDYEITKNLSKLDDSQLEGLCAQTDAALKSKTQANAVYAQLCAAACSALNHWRILSEIPLDLRDNDEVTKTLKNKFHQHKDTWEFILKDIS
uniref:hypothetical protein n=1 Tax=Ningiella ruwaisensis TaxID=2364274 RepID=UPI00109FD150|nr:hypothetical protein [Ningiella ruwaisensis]